MSDIKGIESEMAAVDIAAPRSDIDSKIKTGKELKATGDNYFRNGDVQGGTVVFSSLFHLYYKRSYSKYTTNSLSATIVSSGMTGHKYRLPPSPYELCRPSSTSKV